MKIGVNKSKVLLFIVVVAVVTAACQGTSLKNKGVLGTAKDGMPDTAIFNTMYPSYKEKALYHRRFKHADIDSLVQIHQDRSVLAVRQIGKSVQGRAIYELAYGQGGKKVMLWSQMHGDEPTATMAMFDLFNFLEGKDEDYQSIRDLLQKELTLHFIPMLNPDGAEQYTRRNAQQIDLNRDARATQTIEGALLRKRGMEIKPDYGFNLHDQNIYYNVPGTKNPVTISLLAPAYNHAREINEVRGGAMQIIVGMNRLLQQYIPDAVAKYDDTHSPRGFGDNFQSWNASTVLIESGGLKGDPEKQEIRRLNFIIILNALIEIAEDRYKEYPVDDYENIPFNSSQLHDIVIRNLELTRNDMTYKTDMAIRRGEITVGRDYYVRGRVEDIGDLRESYGYEEIDAEGFLLVPAKVDDKPLADIKSISGEQALKVLKSGILAVPIRTVEPNRDGLYSLPIILFAGKSFYPTTTIDLGGSANFFIGDKRGNLRYAIVNGYMVDLSKEEWPTIKNKVW